tara:strand:- start:123 stop:455 length:333 start_codon:yes stop_codon:yes gene_type:complete
VRPGRAVHRPLASSPRSRGADVAQADPDDLKARALAANVEIAICGMAEYFLGTKTSSFTLAIVEERQAVFGQAAGTAAEMDLDGKAVVQRAPTRLAGRERTVPAPFKDEL